MARKEPDAGDRFLYFGYGSNMLSTRLKRRTPSARGHCTGHVTGRRLTFNKMSDDHSGKGDAQLTGDPADRVEGVLFWIDRAQKPALDEAEALGRGYDEAVVDVITPNGTVKALAYVASAGATDPTRRPYHWYKRLVLAGAIPARPAGRSHHGDPRNAPPAGRSAAPSGTKLEAEAALAACGIVVD